MRLFAWHAGRGKRHGLYVRLGGEDVKPGGNHAKS